MKCQNCEIELSGRIRKFCSPKCNRAYWYKNNKQYHKNTVKTWQTKNKSRVIENKKRFKLDNPNYEKNWKRNNPDKIREHKHKRRLLMGVSENNFTSEDIKWLFIDQEGYCAYCNCDLDESGYHIDHVIPISRGGSNSRSNIALACPTCNLRKNSKTAEEFVSNV